MLGRVLNTSTMCMFSVRNLELNTFLFVRIAVSKVTLLTLGHFFNDAYMYAYTCMYAHTCIYIDICVYIYIYVEIFPNPKCCGRGDAAKVFCVHGESWTKVFFG